MSLLQWRPTSGTRNISNDDWQSTHVEEGEHIDGNDPANAVRRILASGEGLEASYQLMEEACPRWWLRRDARGAVVYDTHYLRLSKRLA